MKNYELRKSGDNNHVLNTFTCMKWRCSSVMVCFSRVYSVLGKPGHSIGTVLNMTN